MRPGVTLTWRTTTVKCAGIGTILLVLFSEALLAEPPRVTPQPSPSGPVSRRLHRP
jgi:hypothetical protein